LNPRRILAEQDQGFLGEAPQEGERDAGDQPEHQTALEREGRALPVACSVGLADQGIDAEDQP
jgi:hypothetical protein